MYENSIQKGLKSQTPYCQPIVEEHLKKRPGRKLGAEKRRVAKQILSEFSKTDEFTNLPRPVQLAIQELSQYRDRV